MLNKAFDPGDLVILDVGKIAAFAANPTSQVPPVSMKPDLCKADKEDFKELVKQAVLWLKVSSLLTSLLTITCLLTLASIFVLITWGSRMDTWVRASMSVLTTFLPTWLWFREPLQVVFTPVYIQNVRAWHQIHDMVVPVYRAGLVAATDAEIDAYNLAVRRALWFATAIGALPPTPPKGAPQ